MYTKDKQFLKLKTLVENAVEKLRERCQQGSIM